MNCFKDSITNLMQDGLTGTLFGSKLQLKVLGYSKPNSTKYYIVSCSICSEDRELFGDSNFLSSLGHLKAGKHPCGCSTVPKWNLDQQQVRLSRALSKMDYELVSASEPYKDQTTKLVVSCKLHGSWNSNYAAIIQGRTCRKCADVRNSDNRVNNNNKMIESFLSTGSYHPDTIFYRSDRKTSQGAKNYWWVECPVCNSTGEITSCDLRRGNQSCACIKNQRQAYINLVADNGITLAIKFGISRQYEARLQKQNRKSIYNISNYNAWEFPTKESCRLAELECKQSFECGIVSKEHMFDGFSETTYIHNLDKIAEIFEKHGGVTIN